MSAAGSRSELYHIHLYPDGQTKPFRVYPLTTLKDLMDSYERYEGVPVDQQRFFYSGKQLDPKKTFAIYSIGDQAVLHFILRMSGG